MTGAMALYSCTMVQLNAYIENSIIVTAMLEAFASCTKYTISDKSHWKNI